MSDSTAIYTDDDCLWCKGTGVLTCINHPDKACRSCDGVGKRRDFRAEAKARHAARGLCTAEIHHGPGRQSITFCERQAGHPIDKVPHRVTVAVWEWESHEASVDDFGEVHER